MARAAEPTPQVETRPSGGGLLRFMRNRPLVQRASVIDAAIGALRAEPVDRLLDPAPPHALRNELKHRLSHTLGHPNVMPVFLTESFVQ